MDIVTEANELFHDLKLDAKPIRRVKELQTSASSMFVAIYEKMFSTRLGGIERKPVLVKQYQENAQIVIQALSDVLGVDLAISAEAIVSGSLEEIRSLLSIFRNIWDQVVAKEGHDEEEEEEEARSLVGGGAEIGGAGGLSGRLASPHRAATAAAATSGTGHHRRHQIVDPSREEYEERLMDEEYERQYEEEEKERRSSLMRTTTMRRGVTGAPHHVPPPPTSSSTAYPQYGTAEQPQQQWWRRHVAREEEEEPSHLSLAARRSSPERPSQPPHISSSATRPSSVSPSRRAIPSPARRRSDVEEEEEEAVSEEFHDEEASSHSPFGGPRMSETGRETGEEERDEFAMLERLGMKFPAHYAEFRRGIRALRALAQHRTEAAATTTEASRRLASAREREKGRFRRGYDALIEDERREFQMARVRRAAEAEARKRREAYERRLERERMRRLTEDLRREAEARRLRRRAREEALVRGMFAEALEVERERVMRASRAERERIEQQDRDALERFERARAAAEERHALLVERLARESEARNQAAKERREALARLQRELKRDFEVKLERLKVELDAAEETTFRTNARAVERAFGVLNDEMTTLRRAAAEVI